MADNLQEKLYTLMTFLLLSECYIMTVIYRRSSPVCHSVAICQLFLYEYMNEEYEYESIRKQS